MAAPEFRATCWTLVDGDLTDKDTLCTQVPAAQEELQTKGYNSFHCYASSQIQLFEGYLALDAANSIQSCATIWGSERA